MGLFLGVVAVGGGSLIPAGSDQQAMANGVTDSSGTDDPKGDPDRIQGTWVRISTDGVKADKTAKMVVKKATHQPEGDISEGAVAFVFEWKTEGKEGGSHNRVLLDPTGTHKTLDFFPEVEGGPKVYPGIYKLEGDTLTVCFRPVAGERPTEFVAGGKGGVLDIYKRAKP